MTLVPAAIILVGAATEAARRDRLRLRRDHASRRRRGVDRAARCWPSRSDRRLGGARARAPACRRWSRSPRSIGFGTKAGLMPLHAWLPRAHPIAPAPISALMSGVMVKVALYGLIRVLVRVARPAAALARGDACSALGAAVGAGRRHLRALPARAQAAAGASTRSRTSAIIVLGLGACLLLRAHGADEWAALAFAAALLHAINHAVFKALLFLGAGAFERATGSARARPARRPAAAHALDAAPRSWSARWRSPGCRR